MTIVDRLAAESAGGAPGPVVIGLVADTHGLFRPQVAAALAGVSMILHAGDVGDPRVMRALRAIAPVHAVFGNVDDAADPELRPFVRVHAGGRVIRVSHGHELGRPTPARLLASYEGDILVFGHTHRALVQRSGARLVVNPGAAGPRRFDVKPSVARLIITAESADAEIVWLE